MRCASTILLALTALGCAGEDVGRFPVDPTGQVPVNHTTTLLGMVVDSSGVCIPGATVHVKAGQRAGEAVTQTTPCNAWGYEGGFVFKDLTVGVEMTLQASAPGYAVEEKKAIPSSGPQMAILFTPSRIATGDGGGECPWCY
jgi:hypothetical protein